MSGADPWAAFEAVPSNQAPAGWTPDRERQFQTDMQMAPGYREWFHGFARRFGEAPNLNDPSFNYRQGWAAGVRPEPYAHDDVRHWPSATPGGRYLKAPEHETRWMEHFMEATGVDPHEAAAADWQRASEVGGEEAMPRIPPITLRPRARDLGPLGAVTADLQPRLQAED